MIRHLFLFVPLLFGLSAPAWSDDTKASRERAALRRAQQQLAQVQAQMATLEQDKLKLGQELTQAAKALKAAEGRAARLNRELKAEQQQREALQRDLDLARQDAAALKSQLQQERQRLAETQASLSETQRRAAALDADKRVLEGVRSRLERELAQSEERNKALYAIGRDLMTRFERKTCNEILAEGEPFLGLRRVQTENLLELYRDKLDEHKLIKPPGG